MMTLLSSLYVDWVSLFLSTPTHTKSTFLYTGQTVMWLSCRTNAKKNGKKKTPTEDGSLDKEL